MAAHGDLRRTLARWTMAGAVGALLLAAAPPPAQAALQASYLFESLQGVRCVLTQTGNSTLQGTQLAVSGGAAIACQGSINTMNGANFFTSNFAVVEASDRGVIRHVGNPDPIYCDWSAAPCTLGSSAVALNGPLTGSYTLVNSDTEIAIQGLPKGPIVDLDTWIIVPPGCVVNDLGYSTAICPYLSSPAAPVA